MNWTAPALAIAMGQFGGWWAASKRAKLAGVAQGFVRAAGARDAGRPQWKLRQMFALTTVVCILAAALAALGVPIEVYRILAAGLAIQAALTAAVIVVLLFRRST